MKKMLWMALLAAVVAGCGKELPVGTAKKGPAYRVAPISRTDVVRSVSATGKVTPRNTSSGLTPFSPFALIWCKTIMREECTMHGVPSSSVKL